MGASSNLPQPSSCPRLPFMPMQDDMPAEDFWREISILRTCRHDNIVQFKVRCGSAAALACRCCLPSCHAHTLLVQAAAEQAWPPAPPWQRPHVHAACHPPTQISALLAVALATHATGHHCTTFSCRAHAWTATQQ